MPPDRPTKRKRSLNAWMTLSGLHTVFLGSPLLHASDRPDIHASIEYANFIREIAVPTALAETPAGDFVKFLQMGKNQGGEVVVRGIGLLSVDQHAPESDLDDGADVTVVAHVHHKTMAQNPVKEDALAVRRLGVPGFVISFDGRLIWEVGIISGKEMYREIGQKRIGQWMELK